MNDLQINLSQISLLNKDLKIIFYKNTQMKKIFKLLALLLITSIMTACTNSFAARKLTNSGNAFLEEGDFTQAISRFESALELNSDVFETRFLLSKAYYSQQKCDKALENIIIASHLNDSSSVVYSLMGRSYECYANSIYNKNLKDKEQNNIIRQGYNKRDLDQYIYNLEKSVDSYKKYYTMTPTAYDALDLNIHADNIKTRLDKIKYNYTGK